MNTDPQTRVREAVREHIDALPTPAGDVEAVLVRATRRNASSPGRARLRWLVPAGAAIAVAGAIGVSIFVPRPDKPVPAPPAVPWLPADITAPNEEPPKLPADRAVGLGSVIYSPCEKPNEPATCREYVITEDGAHYRIPWTSDKYGNEDDSATLSPDGRWLGVTSKGEYVLRDLTGTQTRTVSGRALVGLAWSPDSRWLIIGPSGAGPDPEPVWRVDTRTGESSEVKAQFRILSRLVIDVNRKGEVLLTVPDARCREAMQICIPNADGLSDVALVDPDRGEKPLWTRKLDDSVLRDNERAAPVRLTPDGDSLLVALIKEVEMPSGRARSPASGDLLLFDLADGRSTRRYDVIDGTLVVETMPGGGESSRPDMSWTPMAHEGDGILLQGVKAHEDWEETSQVDSQIDLVDPETGEQRTVTRAPDLRLIGVRGSVSASG